MAASELIMYSAIIASGAINGSLQHFTNKKISEKYTKKYQKELSKLPADAEKKDIDKMHKRFTSKAKLTAFGTNILETIVIGSAATVVCCNADSIANTITGAINKAKGESSDTEVVVDECCTDSVAAFTGINVYIN